ncbi:MAG: hypothetical protein ACI868_000707, partial [Granulosicoccus sp.]
MQKLPTLIRWLLLKVFIFTAVIMTLYEFIKEVVSQGMLTHWESNIVTILVTATLAMITAALLRARLRAAYINEQKL